MEGDHIDCWVRHKKFMTTRDGIQNFLEIRPPSQTIIVQYKDRLDSIKDMVLTLGGSPKKSSMNTRTIMPFPTLIMGLIAEARLKLPNGLTVVQRDYPIGAHTVTRSTTHIKSSKTGVSSILWDRIEDEWGDTEEEIDRFTIAPETSAQTSSSTPA